MKSLIDYDAQLWRLWLGGQRCHHGTASAPLAARALVGLLARLAPRARHIALVIATTAAAAATAQPAQAETLVNFSHAGNRILVFGHAKDDFIRIDADAGKVTVRNEAEQVYPGRSCDIVSAHEVVCEPKFRKWSIIVYGAGGDDHISGAGSSAEREMMLFGYDGEDVILGGPGDDRIRGGQGDDHLNGAVGADTVIGDGAADSILGGAGSDFLDASFQQRRDPDRNIDCGGGRDRVEADAEDPQPLSC